MPMFDPMLDGVILLSNLLLFILGLLALAVVVMFVIDVSQTHDAVRRNYPVIGRFRYLFQTLGEFFRQYFFAMDREEMPFNRAERDWIEKSSEGKDNTSAFGSTRSLTPPGTAIFVNAPFPVLDEYDTEAPHIMIGEGTAHPYAARSLINVSAMSYGSISKPAIQALSRGAKMSGCWLNTGEGGLSEYHLEGGCDIVFQIGTAKYGVRTQDGGLDENKLRDVAAYETVRMFEIKLSQGAKPGKGGLLPGSKITPEIAEVRGIPQGKDSVSPNRHPEVSDNGALLDFIDRVRGITGKPTGIKTVVSAPGWLDELFSEINRRGPQSAPDFITVDSGDGGTGAAPMPLMDNVGLPIREALPLVVDALVRHGLRDRVKVICSGKLVTPAEVAWAYCAGTDFVNSARGFMFALGCIQSLKCNKNTCPTGITTHDRRLQKGLDPEDKAERVANFVKKIEYGVNLIAHSCGADHPRELRREHVRLVQGNGVSVLMSELYPDAEGKAAA
jgi:glutamate synthase domain-containing protein 2